MMIALMVVLVFASTVLAQRMIIRPGLLTDEMLRRGYQWHPRHHYRWWSCDGYSRAQDWVVFGIDCAHSAIDIWERIKALRERGRRDRNIIFVVSSKVKEVSCSTPTPCPRRRPSYAPAYPRRSISPPFEIKNINKNIISIGGEVVEKKTEEKKDEAYNENKNQIVVKLPTKADTAPSPAPTTQPTQPIQPLQPTRNEKIGSAKMIMGCVFSAIGAVLLTLLVSAGIKHFRHSKQQPKAPPQQPPTSEQSKTEQSSTQQESTKAQT